MAKDTALSPRRQMNAPDPRKTPLRAPKAIPKGSIVRPNPSVKLFGGSNDDALSIWLSNLGIKDATTLLDELPGPSRQIKKDSFVSPSAASTIRAPQPERGNGERSDKIRITSSPKGSITRSPVLQVEEVGHTGDRGDIKLEPGEPTVARTPPSREQSLPPTSTGPDIIDLTSSPVDAGPSASEERPKKGDEGVHTTTPERSPIAQRFTRTPGRRRRIILDSDDEDASASPPFPSFISTAPPRAASSAGSSPASLHKSRNPSPAASPTRSPVRRQGKAKRPQAYRFIADAASDDGSNGEEEADESLGSLVDFIVDDDVVEYETDSEGERTSDSLSEPEFPRRARRSPVRSRQTVLRNVIEILDTSDEDEPDIDEGQDILRYSPPPRRTVPLPDLSVLAINDSPPRSRLPTLTPSKKVLGKDWTNERERIAQRLFSELDKKVFGMRLGPEGANAIIEWNNRLLKTAGQAHKKRERKADGTQVSTYRITLSDKVLTGEEQILSTVAHEMCHLATWIISDDHKHPHGKVFKSWQVSDPLSVVQLTGRGRKVMRARPDIEVTTRHSYTIEYKYEWKCANEQCTATYKRHSKSIDTEKERCGRCKGRLIPMFESKAANPFQTYLKTYMSQAKAAMPGASHGEVMRALSKRWSEAGASGGHAAFWATYRP